MQYNQGYGGGYGAKTPQAFSPHDAYGVPQHPGAYGGQAPEYGGYQGYPGYPGYQGYQPPSSDLDDSGTPYTTDQFSPQGYAAQGYGAMPGYMPQGGGEYEQSSALQTTRGATGVRDISSATHPSYTSRTGVTSSESTPRTPRGASGQAPAIVVVPRASGAKRAFTLVLGISAVVFIGTVLVIAARLMPVKITTTPKPVRVEHQNLRPPLLFCTVGYTFEDDQDLLGSELPCDYLIYSDLIANNGTFAPLYGTRSWDAYKTVSQALGMATLTAGGVSFTLSEGAGQNSTLDVIQQRDQIVKSFITDRMLALGAFDYEPTAGVPLSKLKDFFKYLNKTLPSQDPASMVFLGVFLATNVIADAFIADISQIPEISTLILETHITLRQAHLGGHTDCHAYPISAVGIKNLANNTVPRLEVAEHAVNLSRSRGDMFRVVFSSTMGVMVYKQVQGKQLDHFRQPCSTWNMGDYDVTCDPGLDKKLEENDLASYAVANRGAYLFSFEDNKSLTRKTAAGAKRSRSLAAHANPRTQATSAPERLSCRPQCWVTPTTGATQMERYLPASSDGWCLFDVHRDVYWTCGLTIPTNPVPDTPIEIKNAPTPMQRVKTVKGLMRSIKRG
ncbi:uncharacterized protein [Dermacentor albipictus]|uniref:uncharacterized protein isoform X4 n=1 Tax=Dermacentor albipictus TaxID=60249 RepID=UPI0038FC7BB3